jgi:hypothetical protein
VAVPLVTSLIREPGPFISSSSAIEKINMDNKTNSPSDQLDSWKEIAAHFKRAVRTVHRSKHANGGSIFAYRHELDALVGTKVKRRPGNDWRHIPNAAGTRACDIIYEAGGCCHTNSRRYNFKYAVLHSV